VNIINIHFFLNSPSITPEERHRNAVEMLPQLKILSDLLFENDKVKSVEYPSPTGIPIDKWKRSDAIFQVAYCEGLIEALVVSTSMEYLVDQLANVDEKCLIKLSDPLAVNESSAAAASVAESTTWESDSESETPGTMKLSIADELFESLKDINDPEAFENGKKKAYNHFKDQDIKEDFFTELHNYKKRWSPRTGPGPIKKFQYIYRRLVPQPPTKKKKVGGGGSRKTRKRKNKRKSPKTLKRKRRKVKTIKRKNKRKTVLKNKSVLKKKSTQKFKKTIKRIKKNKRYKEKDHKNKFDLKLL